MMMSDRRQQRDEYREKLIRELFRKARASFPNWHHVSLMRWIWRRRPYGAKLSEMMRIAKEFEKPQ